MEDEASSFRLWLSVKSLERGALACEAWATLQSAKIQYFQIPMRQRSTSVNNSLVEMRDIGEREDSASC